MKTNFLIGSKILENLFFNSVQKEKNRNDEQKCEIRAEEVEQGL